MSEKKKVLNEYNLVQKVMKELKTTDEVLFTIGANTTKTFPFEGTLFDDDGNEYNLEREDSITAFKSLLVEHRLTYSVLVSEKKIRFFDDPKAPIVFPVSVAE